MSGTPRTKRDARPSRRDWNIGEAGEGGRLDFPDETRIWSLCNPSRTIYLFVLEELCR